MDAQRAGSSHPEPLVIVPTRPRRPPPGVAPGSNGAAWRLIGLQPNSPSLGAFHALRFHRWSPRQKLPPTSSSPVSPRAGKPAPRSRRALGTSQDQPRLRPLPQVSSNPPFPRQPGTDPRAPAHPLGRAPAPRNLEFLFTWPRDARVRTSLPVSLPRPTPLLAHTPPVQGGHRGAFWVLEREGSGFNTRAFRIPAMKVSGDRRPNTRNECPDHL